MHDAILQWVSHIVSAPWIGVAIGVGFVSCGAAYAFRKKRAKRRLAAIREEAIKAAAHALDQREQFAWTYHSGIYVNRKSIPRTLDPSFMTEKERARRDNRIGEFSPEGRYLEPPESSWD
jgi:hypothetical protein